MLDSPPSFSKAFTGWLFKYHCEFMNINIMYFELVIFAQIISFLAIGASSWVFVTCPTATGELPCFRVTGYSRLSYTFPSHTPFFTEPWFLSAGSSIWNLIIRGAPATRLIIIISRPFQWMGLGKWCFLKIKCIP